MADSEKHIDDALAEVCTLTPRVVTVSDIPEARRLLFYRSMLDRYTEGDSTELRIDLSRRTEFPLTLDEQLLTLHDKHRLPADEHEEDERGDDLIRRFGLKLSSPIRRLIDATSLSDDLDNTRKSQEDVERIKRHQSWKLKAELDEINFMQRARGSVNTLVQPFLEQSENIVTPLVDLPQNTDDLTHAILVRNRERIPNSFSTYIFTKMAILYGRPVVSSAILEASFLVASERHDKGLPTVER
jgi:hypothetical protein